MANYRRSAANLLKGTILGIAELYERDIRTPNGDGQVGPLEKPAVAETPARENPDSEKPSKAHVPAEIPPKD